jgi:hypothetical protein
MRRWHVYHLLDIIVHPPMLRAKVGLKVGYFAQLFDLDLVVVNIWDVVGEEQIVKGEYKVISGRVYVIFFTCPTCSPLGWACSDCLIFCFFPSSNDLSWDGESKRIIAVGDGKEKSVYDTTIKKKINLFSLRLGSAMLFLWIRVLRPERFWDIRK